MEKLQGKSFDIVKENISRLKELFPEVFAEGKIDFEKLQLVLGENIELSNERYSLNWKGKGEAIKLAQKQSTGTLRPCREESVNFDTTKNLYIEGDNLEVLRLLQNSYRNKVKIIYIDPPYNTGNDFVYKDDFRDNISNYKEKMNESLKSNADTNGRFHTDWLNMMYPRLQIARNLLKADGIIFISIDNKEVDNLRKICDEIFGKENFIEEIVWKNKYGSGAQTRGFIEVHEYILCYSKNPILNLTSELGEQERKKYVKKDEKFEKLGGYRTQPLMTRSLGDRANLVYPIYYKGVEILPDKQWVWSREHLEEAIADNCVEFRKKDNGSYTVEAKKYLYDESGNIRRGKPVSVLNGPFNQAGTQENKELFEGKTLFDFTKPSDLIKYLISLEINGVKDNECIILDFFAGSSTTAHAVMKLNAEECSKRKFIMVQIPEQTPEISEARKERYENICQIGKERIRRAGKKILEENKDNEDIENLDIGFKVFKLDYTNLKIWDGNGENLKADMIDMINPIKEDRSQEDVVYEILLKYGVDLTMSIEEIDINGYKVFSVGKGYLLICLENDLSLELIQSLAERRPKRVVFYDKGFRTETVRINGEQILKKFGVEDIRVI
ncbi:site-specific DNA-methyltransferase [Clostridium sp.]|uniref:site-specific DNA-methyltransferase n=1 Tax=Clostridium sp. TaxID=1506 RepID=UPI001A3BAE86|nr:site-specific DNA-methyltransferase [Clostridium sp.]MBK5242624.1 site-specific DNA-methyltransferase [Clostridium sp.]